ncbi:MAG TPA: NACHT domain-containing protein, partial [Candidatus Ozemobacteraceae bacterium]|nr:NACHT domain-containing protein [Candidatus Ozemobacteraceae bacterium]
MNRALQESLVSERLIRVYFCSPFASLQDERTHLLAHLYPRLEKFCLDRGVSFVPVDVRLDRHANVAPSPDLLPVLFDDLVRSRPFFIGIFSGENDPPFPYLPPDLLARFPKLAEMSGASLSDLEVELAVLNRPQSHEEAYFYFLGARDKPHRPPSWTDRLKATTTPIRENIRSADELAELIFTDLRTAIERLFPEPAPLSVQRRRQETQESFARRHALSHLWRQTTFDKLSQHVQLDEGPPLVVVGPTGSGKSGLLAAWALRHRSAFPDDFCHLHFVGSSPEDTQLDYILRRTIADMKAQLGLPEHIPHAPRDLKAEFALWLHLASARSRTIIIFDGIDKLQSSATTIDLSWLPIALPARVRIMLSVSPSSGKPLGIPESWPLLMLDPLNAAERRQFIEEYLGPYKAKISQPRLQRLIEAPGSGNPLILRSLLWEMRRKNFAESKDDQFRELLLRGSVEELTRELMTRAHRDLDLERPELVSETLSLLWAARRGLTDRELQDLLAAPDHPLPHLQMSVVRSRLDGLVFSHNGLMSLFHPSLRELIEMRFLKDPDKCRELHLKLAEYFLKSPTAWRRLEEGPWHLYKAGATKELRSWLFQPEIFAEAWGSNPDDVRLFAHVCFQEPGETLVQLFDELIKHPAQFSPQAVAGAAEFLFERGHVPEAISLFRGLVRLFRQSGA